MVFLRSPTKKVIFSYERKKSSIKLWLTVCRFNFHLISLIWIPHILNLDNCGGVNFKNKLHIRAPGKVKEKETTTFMKWRKKIKLFCCLKKSSASALVYADNIMQGTGNMITFFRVLKSVYIDMTQEKKIHIHNVWESKH